MMDRGGASPKRLLERTGETVTLGRASAELASIVRWCLGVELQ